MHFLWGFFLAIKKKVLIYFASIFNWYLSIWIVLLCTLPTFITEIGIYIYVIKLVGFI